MDKAVIYNRVSTTEQSPELQIKECEELCKSKGWEVVDRLQEQASAYKDDSKREKFQELLQRAEKREFNHIVVWNMDRFSRQPEEEVLRLVKKLNLLYGVDIVAVKGDLWSELVQSIGQIKQMGFIGEAISDFLEKIIRGLEFQRAYRESKTKSERVKLAIRKEQGKKAFSYKGNKWGRKNISETTKQAIIEAYKSGDSYSKICSKVLYYDKNRNKKQVSKGLVHKVISVHKAQQQNNIMEDVHKTS